MKKPIWQHILFSALIVVVLGGIFSRLLPCHWSAMVHDVGESGACIVFLLFNLIYAIFIIVGIVLSIWSINILCGKTKLYFSIVSSGFTIALWYIASVTIYFPKIDSFEFMCLLIVFSFATSIGLYFIDKNLTSLF